VRALVGWGSWLRVGCSRLAGNQIGAAGVEALARALPPSLTTLDLERTCGVWLVAVALGRGMRCGAGSQMWCVVLGPDLVVADRLGRATSARIGGLGLVVEGRLLAACRKPNRSCGCGGAGARTAAESDDA
jgi:hypothetical protein